MEVSRAAHKQQQIKIDKCIATLLIPHLIIRERSEVN